MNEKEQQLSFEKGITNVPSDALCSDNALADSRDLVYDNGEHKVIQRPVVHLDRYVGCHEMPNFLYIHKTSIDVYIGYFESSKQITFGYRDTEYPNFYVHFGHFIDFRYNSSTQITSIGKTIIISNDEGMHYFLWDVDQDIYKYLGDRIPEPQITFYLKQEGAREGVINSGDASHVFSDGQIIKNKQADFNDFVIGLYSKNKKSVSTNKKFCLPFFARVAVKMYDGSYTLITNPVLLFPSVSMNTYMHIKKSELSEDVDSHMRTSCIALYITQETDYTDFKDIVSNVTVFISRGVDVYDTSMDQNPIVLSKNDIVRDGVYRGRLSDISEYHTETVRAFNIEELEDWYKVLRKRESSEIARDLKSISVFYKLADIGCYPIADKPAADYFDTHYLENLTTQEILDHDDYYSRCALSPNFLFSYNSRLNIANVKRGMFEGYDFFMPYDNSSNGNYSFYVKIKTESGFVWVKHEKTTSQKQGGYFYYPDSRARKVIIYKDGTCILDEELTEHEGLNGAFFFKGLPGIDFINEETVTPTEDPTGQVSNNYKEILPNYIIQSEVNNPFVFFAEGYFKVGTGKILGMSTITQALSQGQFGQFPLLAFSDNGIWSLSVANTGYYDSIHPMSREVCNNAKSITQTDGAVFFASEKGLMMIIGNDVRCVSEQLNGKVDSFPSEYIGLAKYDFKTFLSKGCIAYDYRDSLLWILGGNASYSYIYSIKSGTFSMCSISPNTRIINNYPDTLIQLSDNTVVSLLERVDINKDEGEYGGKIVTRPMKFENALALKSLLQVRHITDMQGTLKLRIFASNNFKKWVELHSLGGMPWKYYRFAYTFEGLKATDRFAGSVVVTQERRTDKMR